MRFAENERLVRLITSPDEFGTAQHWYQNHIAFRSQVDTILVHLNITPGSELGGRLHSWGSRDFQTDYQDPAYAELVTALRATMEAMGGLTPQGLVTPDPTPSNSPDRRGGAGRGDGNAGGAAAVAQ